MKTKKTNIKTKKTKKMVVYLVSKTQPNYDCGSTWTSIVNNIGYKTSKRAYDALVKDMLEEMGLKSISEVPDPNGEDYDAMHELIERGIHDWGVPNGPSDFTHKTCDGYIQTDDGEITYDIQTLEIEE